MEIYTCVYIYIYYKKEERDRELRTRRALRFRERK